MSEIQQTDTLKLIITQVVGTTLSILAKNFIFFLILGIIIEIPYALQFVTTLQSPNNSSLIAVVTVIIVLALSVILICVAMTLAYQHTKEEPFILKEAINIAFGKLVPILLTMLAILLIGAILIAPLLFLAPYLVIQHQISFLIVIPLLIIGIIPAMIFYFASCLYMATSIFEDKSYMSSVSRSWELTKGNRMNIFTIYLFLTLILIATLGAIYAVGTLTGVPLAIITLIIGVLSPAFNVTISAIAISLIFSKLQRTMEPVTIKETNTVVDTAVEPAAE